MPNHVTNKIIFCATRANEVFSAICTGGCIDFNKLIAQPPHLYQGNLSADDEKDFPLNWNSWNRQNWGTKWSAYDGASKVEGDKAILLFDTAWSVPYPVIAAFCNRFNIPFEHRYFDEGYNFWGIEKWETSDGQCRRTSKRRSEAEDRDALALELKGYNKDEEEDS